MAAIVAVIGIIFNTGMTKQKINTMESRVEQIDMKYDRLLDKLIIVDNKVSTVDGKMDVILREMVKR
jgi:hypothetical protein